MLIIKSVLQRDDCLSENKVIVNLDKTNQVDPVLAILSRSRRTGEGFRALSSRGRSRPLPEPIREGEEREFGVVQGVSCQGACASVETPGDHLRTRSRWALPGQDVARDTYTCIKEQHVLLIVKVYVSCDTYDQAKIALVLD